jgi:hypothetical protein
MTFLHGACPATCAVETESYALDPLKDLVEYCEGTDGIYYMNGISTCQTATDSLTEIYMEDFEFGSDDCTDPDYVRPFETLMDDNLYVINMTTDYYLNITEYAIENCCLEEDDYSTYISTWEEDIAYIDDQKSHYSGTEIEESLDTIVALATSILNQLQGTTTTTSN